MQQQARTPPRRGVEKPEGPSALQPTTENPKKGAYAKLNMSKQENKQMRPTEVNTRKRDTLNQVGKTTEVKGQTAKEASTHQNKKIHVRDSPKAQPDSKKHSESTNRYNCQQKVGIYTTTQNNTTT